MWYQKRQTKKSTFPTKPGYYVAFIGTQIVPVEYNPDGQMIALVPEPHVIPPKEAKTYDYAGTDQQSSQWQINAWKHFHQNGPYPDSFYNIPTSSYIGDEIAQLGSASCRQQAIAQAKQKEYIDERNRYLARHNQHPALAAEINSKHAQWLWHQQQYMKQLGMTPKSAADKATDVFKWNPDEHAKLVEEEKMAQK